MTKSLDSRARREVFDEMLAALKWAVIPAASGIWPRGERASDKDLEMLEKAHAAIARAEACK